MSSLESRYPRRVSASETDVELRLMTPDDRSAVQAFGATLPTHDLLFLRRDITQPKVLEAWVRQLETGEITSLVALKDGVVVGCTAVVRDDHSWSPHVGELRVLLLPEVREVGLGRVLIQESFLLALSLGLEKLTAQMTADQTGAVAVFEDMGFRAEALLRDHVKDAAGAKHDIVILSHDVAEFQARMAQYGLEEVLLES